MVTVVFTYATCNDPKVQIVAVREGRTLTVAQANAVICTMANDPALHSDVEISILLDGNRAFADTIEVSSKMVNERDVIGVHLRELARYLDSEGYITNRNGILCLLGAIALDAAE